MSSSAKSTNLNFFEKLEYSRLSQFFENKSSILLEDGFQKFKFLFTGTLFTLKDLSEFSGNFKFEKQFFNLLKYPQYICRGIWLRIIILVFRSIRMKQAIQIINRSQT